VTAPTAGYAEMIVEALKAHDVRIAAGLPDSLLRRLHEQLADDPAIAYVPVANEADMPGIVAGAYLGGARAVMVMENSGLRQACEPIARLAFCHQLPFVMLMPFRGDFGEPYWWGHNHGQTMGPLLDALRIPWRVVRTLDSLEPNIGRALMHAETGQWPVALVLSGECVEGGRYPTD
jgi:sulfopyruvate decarboxylase subunit alpha